MLINLYQHNSKRTKILPIFKQSYIIDSDFLSNLVSIKKSPKSIEEEENKFKCYPNKSNKAPYQKIEFQIRKDLHWPPITEALPEKNPTIINALHTNGIDMKVNETIKEENNSSTNMRAFSRNLSNSSQKKQRFDDKDLEMKGNLKQMKNADYFDESTRI